MSAKAEKEAGNSEGAAEAASKNGHLKKPRVHTNRMGSQFVKAADILKSEVGQKAIAEITKAQLVEKNPAEPAEKPSASEDVDSRP